MSIKVTRDSCGLGGNDINSVATSRDFLGSGGISARVRVSLGSLSDMAVPSLLDAQKGDFPGLFA